MEMPGVRLSFTALRLVVDLVPFDDRDLIEVTAQHPRGQKTPDVWTDFTIIGNSPLLVNTKATLDATGKAQAALRIPNVNIPSTLGVVFNHAYLVYDAKNNFHMASNPVTMSLVK